MMEPQTLEQWQWVFDMATGLRLIADAKILGLIEGGPSVVLDRVEEVLEEGRKRGLTPSRPPAELAKEVIAMSQVAAGRVV